jgi:hypothetical protein
VFVCGVWRGCGCDRHELGYNCMISYVSGCVWGRLADCGVPGWGSARHEVMRPVLTNLPVSA